jgi:hypothetical protein
MCSTPLYCARLFDVSRCCAVVRGRCCCVPSLLSWHGKQCWKGSPFLFLSFSWVVSRDGMVVRSNEMKLNSFFFWRILGFLPSFYRLGLNRSLDFVKDQKKCGNSWPAGCSLKQDGKWHQIPVVVPVRTGVVLLNGEKTKSSGTNEIVSLMVHAEVALRVSLPGKFSFRIHWYQGMEGFTGWHGGALSKKTHTFKMKHAKNFFLFRNTCYQ